jgi:hypothetical protein
MKLFLKSFFRDASARHRNLFSGAASGKNPKPHTAPARHFVQLSVFFTGRKAAPILMGVLGYGRYTLNCPVFTLHPAEVITAQAVSCFSIDAI